jgi:GT2 family glycosyltransferase
MAVSGYRLDGQMTVSIIIVNFNTSALLRECLASVFSRVSGVDFEVIVVDNASSDDSCEMVSSEFPKARLIRSKENIGFGRANNVGAACAEAEFLFFLNSDTVLLNDAPSILMDFIRGNSSCGICGGNLTNPDGLPVHSYTSFLPGPCDDVYRFFPFLLRLRYGRSYEYNFSGSPRRVAYITGADLLIRSDVFREIGGFDPKYFMYYEETDLTVRVRDKGYSVYSVPGARILHVKGASLEFLGSYKKINFESKYYYLQKHYGKGGAVAAHFIFQLYCRYKMCLSLVSGRKKTYRKMSDAKELDSESFEKSIDRRKENEHA